MSTAPPDGGIVPGSDNDEPLAPAAARASLVNTTRGPGARLGRRHPCFLSCDNLGRQHGGGEHQIGGAGVGGGLAPRGCTRESGGEPFCILIVMMVTQLSDLSNMEETNTKEGEFYCV